MTAMANTASQDAKRLARYEAELKRLAAQLADIGFVSRGSLIRRYTSCGNPGCRCQAEPPQLHGPYWQWTTAVAGKTVTRRVTDEQIPLYQAWIANRRRLATSSPTSKRSQTRPPRSFSNSAQPPPLEQHDRSEALDNQGSGVLFFRGK
jgi:hypothetical protein